MSKTPETFPTLDAIEAARTTLGDRVMVTPVVPLESDRIRPHLPADARVAMKLELFQHAGSFKARGALLHIDALSGEARRHGVTGVSAGNHALALSWAAQREGVSAKVVMPRTADPVRVAGCRAMGAEVILVDDVHAAFSEVDRIVTQEGRTMVHPFEAERTVLGTATCGLELIEAVSDLEAAIIPVGGGGLIAGMARAIKLTNPSCQVIGVEPDGADSMNRSFEAGTPQVLSKVTTIADSLGSPKALPYTFGIARAHVDRMVRINDAQMLMAMTVIFDALKVAVEPAGAASTAAVMGPLKDELVGRKIGVIACGANIGETAFANFVTQGRALLRA